MEQIREILIKAFAVDDIWSVVIRAVFWFLIAIVIIVSMDKAKPEDSYTNLKSNLGFLLLFVVLSGGLVYLLFGFTAAA